jgi:hypothetical protein
VFDDIVQHYVTLQVIGGWREFLMPGLVLELLNGMIHAVFLTL